MDGLTKLLLIIVAVASAYTDIRYRKVYNAVTYSGSAVGLLAAYLRGGCLPLTNISGLVIGLGLLLPLFLLKAVGGGDVKLLATLGAIGGRRFILLTSINMAVIGVLMAVYFQARLWIRERLFRRWRQVGQLVLVYLNLPGLGLEALADSRPIWLPYGAAIAAGALLAVFFGS